MVTYLLKKSYQLKDLKETNFKDLWGRHGIFTTMRVLGKPPKILFFENHIKNLIFSLQSYKIKKKSLKSDILKIIKINLTKKRKYNHLLRVALDKKIISISLRKRKAPKSNFNLELINLKRENPKYKNLKYKKILSHLNKMDNSESDIGLINNKKILETGTSNLLFIKNKKIYSPQNNFYEGNTLKFINSKFKNIIKKNIFVKDLEKYDEIILIGSGKGVASIKTIKQINWKRKSLSQFKTFLKCYQSAIINCKNLKF
tara:strand:- start:48 stop:821 length:774 start_codon:yes stop_codon:yes gene_type:complete